MTKCVSLPGSGQCTTMELGSLEGGYLELLNSNADPLELYHLYDQMDLAGEEEMELCSGARSLPLVPPKPLPTLSLQWRLTATCQCKRWPRSSGQHREQLLSLARGWLSHWERLLVSQPSPARSSLPPPQPALFPDLSYFPAEPDSDTINCEQFSRLLCDIEGDEETREAYANIGEKYSDPENGQLRGKVFSSFVSLPHSP